MKKMILILFVLLTSCEKFTVEHQRDHNVKMLELKQKQAELDYLERLYELRNDIEYSEKIKTIDSLILKIK